MEATLEELLAIIGEKEVQLRLVTRERDILRDQLALLNQESQDSQDK